jgi:hypothetical protein
LQKKLKYLRKLPNLSSNSFIALVSRVSLRQGREVTECHQCSVVALHFQNLSSTLYRKVETYISRNQTAQPRSPFLNSFICERFIYSHDDGSRQTDRGNICKNRSQIHECGNWETEHYNSVWEITKPQSFIFWEYA